MMTFPLCSRRFKQLFLLMLAAGSAGFCHASSTAWQSADHIQVRLLSNLNTLAPDTTFYAALELLPDEHWHVYWQNPGDSGMPVSMNWELPAGVRRVETVWPIPAKIPFGHLTNYGYEGRVIIPVRLQSQTGLSAKPVLKASANWLVCKDTCIPGSAELSLPLTAGDSPEESPHTAEIASYLEEEAQALKLMQGSIEEREKELAIQLFATSPVFKGASDIEFFPINEGLFNSGAKTNIHWKNNLLRLSQKKSDSFYQFPQTNRGLLVVDGEQAWEFEFKP